MMWKQRLLNIGVNNVNIQIIGNKQIFLQTNIINNDSNSLAKSSTQFWLCSKYVYWG